jgi:hypothetical protein
MKPDQTTITGRRITPAVAGNSKTAPQPAVRVLSQPGVAYAIASVADPEEYVEHASHHD